MRWSVVYPIGAAVLAGLHVAGVLLAAPVLPAAEVLAVGLLLVFAAAPAVRHRAGPVWWMVPVALLPLLIEALLTIPRGERPGFGWQVLVPGEPRDRRPILEALGTTFENAGAPLLFAATLLVVVSVLDRGRAPWPWPVAALGLLPGMGVTCYAAVRVVLVADAGESAATGDRVALLLVVSVPVLLAVAATVLLAATLRAGRPGAALGALLLALSAFPVVDAVIMAVPLPYGVQDAVDGGLFGWDAITPSLAVPAPVPAVTLALQLAACLLLVTALRGPRRAGS